MQTFWKKARIIKLCKLLFAVPNVCVLLHSVCHLCFFLVSKNDLQLEVALILSFTLKKLSFINICSYFLINNYVRIEKFIPLFTLSHGKPFNDYINFLYWKLLNNLSQQETDTLNLLIYIYVHLKI